jgi:hypothetical protein
MKAEAAASDYLREEKTDALPDQDDAGADLQPPFQPRNLTGPS